MPFISSSTVKILFCVFSDKSTNPKMSWQDYVDNQLLAKNLKEAAIVGLDGCIWAKVQ